MSIAYSKTRSAKYFIEQYNRSTLREAIEAAARKEREKLVPGLGDYCHIPVDVKKIAEHKGIRFGPDLPHDATEDARLIPRREGFLLHLNPNRTHTRKRFTVAHEIGHTLFYRGLDHQIGVLDKKEIEMEELICDKFASALLMPHNAVAQSISTIPGGTPWEAFATIENICKKLEVSIPALIARISAIKPSLKLPYILLQFKYKANQFTGLAKRLRVQRGVSLGKLNNTKIWFNQSAQNLNMHSAATLFKEWRNHVAHHNELVGRYTLDSEGNIVRAAQGTLCWISEDVNLWVLRDKKWYKENYSMFTSNCLYVGQGWNEKTAYIISIIKCRD